MVRAADWSRFDVLLHELGGIRASMAGLKVSADVSAAVDRHIATVAEAVDALIDDPCDDERAITAWELILTGQDLVASLTETRARSGELVQTAVALRGRAAAALLAADLMQRKKPDRG